MEHPCEQEIDAIRVHCSLPPHSHAVFSVPREDRILVDSQSTGVQWNKARKYKVWMHLQLNKGGCWQLWEAMFPLEPELASNAERRHFRKHKRSRNPITSFLVLLPLISQPPACMLSLFSCVRLCNLIDRSLPGPSVHGISQARILEWLAFSFQAENISFSFQPFLIPQ